MLGKKSSLYLIKEELKSHQINNFGTTEFCQGRTMRWGIAWSFDSSVIFPQPPSKPDKSIKPLTFVMPSKEGEDYDVTSCFSKLTAIFDELQIAYKVHKKFKKFAKLTATVKCNTWSNQRRKRRQKIKCEIEEKKSKTDEADSVQETDTQGKNNGRSGENNEQSMTIVKNEDQKKSKDKVEKDTVNEPSEEQAKVVGNTGSTNDKTAKGTEPQRNIAGNENIKSKNEDETKAKDGTQENNSSSNTGDELAKKVGSTGVEAQTASVASDAASTNLSQTDAVSCSTEADTDFLFKFAAELQMGQTNVELKVTWIEGQNKEHLHQVLQYIKNKLKT